MKKISIIIITLIIGFGAGQYYKPQAVADPFSFDEQEATIRSIEKNISAVVDIEVYQNNSLIINWSEGALEEQKTKELIGSGTGFLISPDGLIITNKHVVATDDPNVTEYKVTLDSGKRYYAQLIGKDPLNDLAVIKIFDKDLPFVELGDSSTLKIGSTVMAIGNALGQYQNTVTKGIVSALSRNLAASDGQGVIENLTNVIQTDAEINEGNSGGPLIDLEGKVVGINVAKDKGASNIGFSIPINDIKPVIESVKTVGRIIRPRLGLRYLMIDQSVLEKESLARDTGALIVEGDFGQEAIVPGSPAAVAGLQKGDIIFEVNDKIVDEKNNLLSVISQYKPGDKVELKVQRGEKSLTLEVILDEFKE